MKKIRSKLISTKSIITLLVVGIFLGGSVFAQQDTSTDLIQSLGMSMNDLVSFLSWAWIFFAMLAGKMMTNDFVYGAVINLDTFLWQTRNIMKNFANFTIGFLFLTYLIKYIFDPKGNVGSFIKEKIVSFLVAGVLIQASWFLLGAVIDLSTVATSAIGSFPASLIEDNSSFQGSLRQELETIRGMSITWDAQAPTGEKNTEEQTTTDALSDRESKEQFDTYLDAILPTTDNLSGPLLFMGISLFKFQSFTSIENVKAGNWESLFMTTGIQFVVVILYSLAMAALFIINVVRIVLLWMVIVFAPFLILFSVLKSIGNGPDLLDTFQIPERLKLPAIIKMIFAPVILTAFMSIMLVFTFAIWGMTQPNQDRFLKDIHLTESRDVSSLEIDGVASSTVEGLKTGFSDLLIFFLLIFLLWQMIKISISTVGGPPMLQKLLGAKGLMGAIGGQLANAKILPGPAGAMSVADVKNTASSIKADLDKKGVSLSGIEDTQRAAMYEQLGITNKTWKPAYNTKLTAGIGNETNFFTTSQTIADEMGGITLNNSNWSSQVISFLSNPPAGSDWTPYGESENLEQYFETNGETAIKKFHKAMGGTDGSAPKTAKELMTHKYT